MADADAHDEFREFADSRLEKLRRFAYLLCGDWQRSEDAVQNALTKMYLAWHRISDKPVDAYARRVVVTAVADTQRRAWFRRENTVDALPERMSSDFTSDRNKRMSVLHALSQLSHRQRATVVLRFWEDYSVEKTAEIMGCSTGTVKSQTARALQTLRGLLPEYQPNVTESVNS